jgi:hypothetical protein
MIQILGKTHPRKSACKGRMLKSLYNIVKIVFKPCGTLKDHNIYMIPISKGHHVMCLLPFYFSHNFKLVRLGWHPSSMRVPYGLSFFHSLAEKAEIK